MSNKRKLGWLKWITILLPPLSIFIYETVRHTFLEGIIEDGWVGNLLAALLVLVISFGFGQAAFNLIARMQTRLSNQNKKLQELNQRIKELAIIEERGRLSREIHDGLAQILAYTMLKIDTLQTLLQSGRMSLSEAERELEQIYQACNDAYNDVREDISGLRPELYDGREFPTILAELLKRFAENNPLETNLELDGIEPGASSLHLFPPATTVQLLRVVQEVLSNVRKHAHARTVKVRLVLDNQIVLSLCDDGGGFDPLRIKTENAGQKFGQIIMRERIESLGGKLDIKSAIGHGTTIQISLPLPTENLGQITPPKVLAEV